MKRFSLVLSYVLLAMFAGVLAVVVHDLFWTDDESLMATLLSADESRKPLRQGAYDGIDVSHHQGVVDWPTVAANKNVKFVYLKATEGATHVDTRYHQNLTGAREAGLPVGSYHFLSARSTIASQFMNFLEHARPEWQDLRPVVDVEWQGVSGWNTQQLADSLELFVWLVSEYYGCEPIIYADAKFYRHHLAAHFAHYPLFIAHYHQPTPEAEGASRVLLWQHDDHGRVAGIGTHVDLDALMPGTSVDDLRK